MVEKRLLRNFLGFVSWKWKKNPSFFLANWKMMVRAEFQTLAKLANKPRWWFQLFSNFFLIFCWEIQLGGSTTTLKWYPSDPFIKNSSSVELTQGLYSHIFSPNTNWHPTNHVSQIIVGCAQGSGSFFGWKGYPTYISKKKYHPWE